MFINVSIQYFQLTKSIPALALSARSKVPCPVIIFVTNEWEITRSSPIDHMHFFFQFVPNKRGIFSCNKRYFELLYSLLVTRLKKNIKMHVIWKF